MTTAIIITFCTLLLLAYIFDVSAAKTKIPSVILLLILGWIIREVSYFFDFEIPSMAPALPILGTVGLILIVLEGSLELEWNKKKATLIKKSFIVSIIPIIILGIGFAYLIQYFSGASFRDSLINALPLCVISSSIAIPSVKSLDSGTKEFVIYESSFSDIIGVLIFNFVALNEVFGWMSFGNFFIQLLIIAVISFVATLALAMMMNKIDHHIKFAPIFLLVILIYAVSKIYHLPGLLFILIFGLFLGNIDELKHIKWIEKLKPDTLNKEVHKFKDLAAEAAFLVRALFFLVFGFLINTAELFNPDTFIWAIGIVAGIFIVRFIILKLARLPLSPLLYIAPRGLITILLFLSIDPANRISLVNNPLLIQVVILSAFVMMYGLMTNKTKEIKKEKVIENNTLTDSIPAETPVVPHPFNPAE